MSRTNFEGQSCLTDVTVTVKGVTTKHASQSYDQVKALYQQYKESLEDCDFRIYEDHKSAAGSFCEVTHYYYKQYRSKDKTVYATWHTGNYTWA